MVTKMFELRQSNKLFAKILVLFFVVALALVIALAPPLETAAYASATNYVCERSLIRQRVQNQICQLNLSFSRF